MKQYKIFISEIAINDLHKITDYIALELLEPETAIKLVAKIKTTIMSLSELPSRNSIVSDDYLASKAIRRSFVDNYIIFYVINDKDTTITIIRILYGKRNWQSFI